MPSESKSRGDLQRRTECHHCIHHPSLLIDRLYDSSVLQSHEINSWIRLGDDGKIVDEHEKSRLSMKYENCWTCVTDRRVIVFIRLVSLMVCQCNATSRTPDTTRCLETRVF